MFAHVFSICCSTTGKDKSAENHSMDTGKCNWPSKNNSIPSY